MRVINGIVFLIIVLAHPGSGSSLLETKGITEETAAVVRARGESKIYRGSELTALGMPVSGIGTGTLYVRGDGTLAGWHIFSNPRTIGADEDCYVTFRPVSPVSQGFCIGIKDEQGMLQTLQLSQDNFMDLNFIGEYPLGWVRYKDPVLESFPLSVELAVFSPFIPLNAKDSGIPATIMRFTIGNTSTTPVEGVLTGWLENHLNKVHPLDAPRLCVTEVQRAPNRVTIEMRSEEVLALTAADLVWFDVFEDFESESYGAWTSTGEAFGSGPSQGTAVPELSGYEAKQLVYSGAQGKDRTGRLVSPAFTIKRRFIIFSIAGGSDPTTTCMNLIVNGEIVRIAAGAESNQLRRIVWEVGAYHGKTATIEIVDEDEGKWGFVCIDDIRFSSHAQEELLTANPGAVDYGSMAITALSGDTVPNLTLDGWAGIAVWVNEGCLPELVKARHYDSHFSNRFCGTLAVPFTLQAGEQRTIDFLITWYVPNRQTIQNAYVNWYSSAHDVAAYVVDNVQRLYDETMLFHKTYYDSTLPRWFLDRVQATTSTLATETCQWWRNGRFWAWEGEGVCYGTCGHVWNFAHSPAWLFPELERSVRLLQDFAGAFDEETGLVGVRGNREYAVDGQAGTILKAYREHLHSPDDRFLTQYWPKIRKAVEFLIKEDQNDDGLIEGLQPNTYDIDFHGPNTYIGSLYLAALRAGEEMARLVGDMATARRFNEIKLRGTKNTEEKLWNGEYFFQTIRPDLTDRNQYGTGCLATQLFGQSWADMLDLGPLYDPIKIETALKSVFTYNWLPDVGLAYRKDPPVRWFARIGEAGLLNCTWPRGGRPARPLLYYNEVWTGIEYQVASQMIAAGLVDEGLAMIRGVAERYDGAKHNPWNEVEYGFHYARALASWGCLIAAEGLFYNGPEGIIAMDPKLDPTTFKGFFAGATGWGSIAQDRTAAEQTNSVSIVWGSVVVKELRVRIPAPATPNLSSVMIGTRPVAARLSTGGSWLRIILEAPATIRRGENLEAVVQW